MNKVIYFLAITFLFISCESEVKESKDVVFIDSIKLFESFNMKKEYDKLIEGDLYKEAQLIDSLNVLLENESDSSRIFRLRKDYYMIEQLYNSKFEQLSSRYTQIVSERLNEYIKSFAEENSFDMIVSGSNGAVLYVSDSLDYTDKMIDFANKKFEN